jgi:hypothetical protein
MRISSYGIAALAAAVLLPGIASSQVVIGTGVGRASAPYAESNESYAATMSVQRTLGSLAHLTVAGGYPLSLGGVAWGSAGVGGQQVAAGHGLRPTLRYGAGFYGYRDDSVLSSGAGAHADLHPGIIVPIGALTGRASAGTSATFNTDVSTMTARVIPAATMALASSQGPVQFEAALDALAVDGAIYPRARIFGTALAGPVSGWGAVSQWMSPHLTEAGFSGGVALRIGLRTQIHSSFAHEPNDPVYWNGSRRSWSFGARYVVGGTRSHGVAAPPHQHAAGAVHLSVPGHPGLPISIAGDFSDWSKIPMTWDGDAWSIVLNLGPGTYAYAFVDGGGRWFVPESTRGRRPDGFGGFQATLIILENG